MYAEGMIRQRTSRDDTGTGPELALPHACCFVSWSLHCTHRKCPCLLLLAMLQRCYALLHYPQRFHGLALVAVANAKALQLPLPSKPGWTASPVLWVLRHTLGHPRQPWDPRDRARQEPPVGARCPVTPVHGMISGYHYDYHYRCMYVCMNVLWHGVTLIPWPPKEPTPFRFVVLLGILKPMIPHRLLREGAVRTVGTHLGRTPPAAEYYRWSWAPPVDGAGALPPLEPGSCCR